MHIRDIAPGLVQLPVGVGGGIVEQEGAGDDLSLHGVDLHVLTLRHVQRQSADGGDGEASVGIDAADHGSQGVGVRGDRELRGRSKRAAYGALIAQLRRVAVAFENLGRVFTGLLGKAGGGVNLYKFFQGLE